MLNLQSFETRQHAVAAVVRFIDGFYNTTRLHPALGYRSPIAFENEFDSVFSQTRWESLHVKFLKPGLAV